MREKSASPIFALGYEHKALLCVFTVTTRASTHFIGERQMAAKKRKAAKKGGRKAAKKGGRKAAKKGGRKTAKKATNKRRRR